MQRRVLNLVPASENQAAKEAKAKEKATKAAAAKLRKQEMAAKTAAGPSKKKQEKQAASEAKQVCDHTCRFARRQDSCAFHRYRAAWWVKKFDMEYRLLPGVVVTPRVRLVV